MHPPDSPSSVIALERRVRRLERALAGATGLLLLTLSLLVWSLVKPGTAQTIVGLILLTLGLFAWRAVRPASAHAAGPGKEILRVHQLVIVDENGVERVVLGPIPDARIQGNLVKRRSPATGLQVNDAAGNERAGVAVLDDGSAVVGIDDDQGHERAHLFWLPHRGSGLLLQGERPNEAISLAIPRPGAEPSKPAVEVTDDAGNPVYAALRHQG